MFVGGCHGAIHSRAFISRASGLFRLGLPRSSKFSSARNTCSLGRVRHVIGTLPGSCHIPFTVCMSKFGCERVTRGLKLPLKAIGDHVFFAHRELRGSLGSFHWISSLSLLCGFSFCRRTSYSQEVINISF